MDDMTRRGEGKDNVRDEGGVCEREEEITRAEGCELERAGGGRD